MDGRQVDRPDRLDTMLPNAVQVADPFHLVKLARALGRTVARWRDRVVAWHRARVSNGPTEAINNLVKRAKRVAFGITNFRNYRIRALLYAGRPN